jgi:hypothetical protein
MQHNRAWAWYYVVAALTQMGGTHAAAIEALGVIQAIAANFPEHESIQEALARAKDFIAPTAQPYPNLTSTAPQSPQSPRA